MGQCVNGLVDIVCHMAVTQAAAEQGGAAGPLFRPGPETATELCEKLLLFQDAQAMGATPALKVGAFAQQTPSA